MEQKNQQFFLTKNEDIMNNLQKKIKKLIYDISWKNKSLYRELFVFDNNDITFKKMKKRVIFLLNKIIAYEITKNYQNLEIFIYEPKNSDNESDFFGNIDDNSNFYMPLEIFLIYQKNITHKFNIIFVTINKLMFKENLLSNDFNKVDYAINKFKKINKKMFYSMRDVKFFHLLNYLQGILESISSDFEIVIKQSLYNHSLKESKFLVEINYQDKWVFDAEFLEDSTIIGKVDPKENIIKRYTYKNFNLEKLEMISKEKINDLWKKVAKKLRNNFQNVWERNDRLYTLIKTTKYLFENLGGKIMRNTLMITASKNTKTKFLKLYKVKQYQGKIYDGLDFQWFFNSYNFKADIINFEYNTVKFEHSILKITDNIIQKLNSVSLHIKQFKIDKFYARKLFTATINSMLYYFDVTYEQTSNKTNLKITIENKEVCEGTYDWDEKKAFFKKLKF